MASPPSCQTASLRSQARQSASHAFHPTPLRFLNNSTATTNATAVVRSFSTTFVFAIVSTYQNLSGYGLAFVVAPTANLSMADSGMYLGLLNATNSTTSDHIFAIELDTIMDPDLHDINSNHVGIDVKSLVSQQAKPAGYYGEDGVFQNLSLNDRKQMQVWVDYDSQTRRLNVTLAPVQVLQYLDSGNLPPDVSTNYVSYNTVLMQNEAVDSSKMSCPHSGTSICTRSGESSVTVLVEGR